MSTEPEQEYDEDFVNLLELIWGEGYLSPGGPEEVEKIIGDTDFNGKSVLDIGCGSGGIDFFLAQKFDTEHITGIDVEKSLIAKCELRAGEKDLKDRITFEHIQPGPLPFPDQSFDIVFTKDSLIHIEDKGFICNEVFRVLKPRGKFIASDWLRGEGKVSNEMQRYIELEDLGFGMGNQQQYNGALAQAGFAEIKFTDRNTWYCPIAINEHKRLSGELYDKLVSLVGKALADHEIETWAAMVVVLEKGELRPTHWQASKC